MNKLDQKIVQSSTNTALQWKKKQKTKKQRRRRKKIKLISFSIAGLQHSLYENKKAANVYRAAFRSTTLCNQLSNGGSDSQ